MTAQRSRGSLRHRLRRSWRRASRGHRAVLAVRVAALGSFALVFPWLIYGLLHDDPPPPPGQIWSVASLVPPLALAASWRREHRVEDTLWTVFAGAFGIGLVGAVWQSRVAPVVGLLTILALPLARRAGRRAPA